jgi:hypothetical protein
MSKVRFYHYENKTAQALPPAIDLSSYTFFMYSYPETLVLGMSLRLSILNLSLIIQ